MGCGGSSAGRARLERGWGKWGSHCLCHGAGMLPRRCSQSLEGGQSQGVCQGPALLAQGPPGSAPPEPRGCRGTRSVLLWSTSTQQRVVAAHGHAAELVLETSKDKAVLCSGLPGTGGALCEEAAAGSSSGAFLSPGTALPCLSLVHGAGRLVQCPGMAQQAAWHRSSGRELKNNSRASGGLELPPESRHCQGAWCQSQPLNTRANALRRGHPPAAPALSVPSHFPKHPECTTTCLIPPPHHPHHRFSPGCGPALCPARCVLLVPQGGDTPGHAPARAVCQEPGHQA